MAEGMQIIRRSRAKEKSEFSEESAVLKLEAGALLKVLSAQRFDAKFHDETGDLWRALIVARLLVVDDHEEGEADGKQFTDYFDLKVDLDVLDELGLDDEDLRNANESDFTPKQRKALLDPASWTVRDGTKPEKLNIVLLGKDWAKKPFHPGLWENKVFIAKVKPRTGNTKGSYTGWDTFVSVNPPKKKKKGKNHLTTVEDAQEAYEENLDQIERDLTEAEEAQMNEALGE